MINLVPETYSAPPAARRRYMWRTTALGLALFASLAVFFAIGGGQPDRPGLNIAMSVLCTVFVLASSYEIVTLIRALDELQQRIHILSWAIGCAAAVIVAFCWGFVGSLLPVTGFDPIFTVLIAVPGYYASLFVLSQRYR
jgi:zinc transporter ZupT